MLLHVVSASPVCCKVLDCHMHQFVTCNQLVHVLLLKVHLVAGLIYGLDFDRIQSTLASPGIRNVRPAVRILHWVACNRTLSF